MSDFTTFCENVSIHVPDSAIGSGMEVTHHPVPKRTIVVHFVESDVPEYLLRILGLILSHDEAWLLAPRFGFRSEWGIRPVLKDACAARFESSEIADLDDFFTKQVDFPNALSDDVYIVSASGTIIVTYDHHFMSSGLGISVNDIALAGRLLQALNDVGAELEVYYTQ